MAEVNKVGIFITVFITLILGTILLSTTADTTQLAETTYTVENESIVLSNTTAVNLANNWVTSITALIAEENTTPVINTTLTEGENFTVNNLNTDNLASISLNDTADAFHTNRSFVTYNYQDDNYIRDGTSRILIGLIKIFFALAVLLTGVWGMYQMGMLEFLRK